MNVKSKHKQKLLLGGLVAILVISSFMYIPVIADSHDDDEDDDGIDDDYEDENEREVEFELSNNEAKIESSLQTGDVHNEFEISMKTGDEGLEFEFEYERDNETVETEIEFEVKITELIEYIDTTADGFYNHSDDETVQVVKLDDYIPIEYSVQTIDTETVHIFYVETTDGVFSATMYVTGEFAEINEVLVAPTQIKIDIGIHNFNYTEDDSVLALKVKLESELEVDYEDDEETEDEEDGRATDEHEVEVSLGDYTGFFSWIETATIDGVEHEVKATPIEINEEENKLYLNYPRGTEIIHDPKIGMTNLLSNTGLLGTTETLLFAAAALLSIAGLILVFRRRRRQ
jgi:LPXTG-motif cell wall-anchored protein